MKLNSAHCSCWRMILVGAIAGFCLIQGCTSGSYKNASSPGNPNWLNSQRHPASEDNFHYPWEVLGLNGESLVPNVYYAEDSENQQVMPLTIHGRKFIDRLIYPTLGHPALYVKKGQTDRLTIVLRLENEIFDRLNPSGDTGDQDAFEQSITVQGGVYQWEFFLVRRDDGTSRKALESIQPLQANNSTIFEISHPSIEVDRECANMPPPFKARKTLRLAFDNTNDATGLEAVPPGLYDLRFQVVNTQDAGLAKANNGKPVFEYQYNAVKVFDTYQEDYSILNITDAQVSGGAAYSKITIDKLNEFVNHVVSEYQSGQDPLIKNAAFITFNGDLHNGGSPAGTSSRFVALTYNLEAHMIVDALKRLPIPIFLTPGNHDGYSGMTAVPGIFSDGEKLASPLGWAQHIGHTLNPAVDKDLVDSYRNASWLTKIFHIPMADVVQNYAIDSGQSNWPNLTLAAFKRDQDDANKKPGGKDDANKNPGGKHVNIFTGQHIRRVPQGLASNDLDGYWKGGWTHINGSIQTDKVDTDTTVRNMILFDGFYQWQKTYGPLYYSWTFGRNHYTTMNSFELRQHRRSGWGMYTVNYGGGLSQVQFDWLKRDLDRNQNANRDLILLAHHDPRGGHEGRNYPYYFRQVDFLGIPQSAGNYIKGEVVDPKICGPSFTKVIAPFNDKTGQISQDVESDCMHDGLEEWMRPDPEFDCLEDYTKPNDPQLHCDVARIKGSDTATPWYSGYEMISLLSGGPKKSYPNLRTFLLGHTHYNSMEVIQPGQALVNRTINLDSQSTKNMKALETANPLRMVSAVQKAAQDERQTDPCAQDPTKPIDPKWGKANCRRNYISPNANGEPIFDIVKYYGDDLHINLYSDPSQKRELALLHMTCVSNLTSQKFQSPAQGAKPQTMLGFTAFKVFPYTDDNRGYTLPQINNVTYYINNNSVFKRVGSMAIPRNQSISYREDNVQKNDISKNPVIQAGMHL